MCISSPNSSSLYSGNEKLYKGLALDEGDKKLKYFESYDDCDEDIDLSDIESNDSDFNGYNDDYHVLNDSKTDDDDDDDKHEQF